MGDLMGGTKRFKELQRSAGGVSQKVLTANLRTMEAQGLVHRGVGAETSYSCPLLLTRSMSSCLEFTLSLR